MSPRRTPAVRQRLTHGLLGLTLGILGLGGASCATSVRTLDALEQARAAVVRAENSAAGKYATDQLMESVKTLGLAESAYCDAPNAGATIDLAVRAQKQAEAAIVRGEAARAREQQAAPAALDKSPMKPAPSHLQGPAATPAAAGSSSGNAPMGAPMGIKSEAL
jgi:hypothetical protein